MADRVSPDDRELTEETAKPAERGTPKPDKAISGAHTWVTEADRAAELAIRYYRTAGDWYGRHEPSGALQTACYERATKIELLMGKANN